jgi:hypothetical protein
MKGLTVMKTAIITLSSALLLALAETLSGNTLDAAAILAIAFASGLLAWTVFDYERKTLSLATLATGREVNVVDFRHGNNKPTTDRLAA